MIVNRYRKEQGGAAGSLCRIIAGMTRWQEGTNEDPTSRAARPSRSIQSDNLLQ